MLNSNRDGKGTLSRGAGGGHGLGDLGAGKHNRRGSQRAEEVGRRDNAEERGAQQRKIRGF